jgi:hypothetical protein
MTELASTLRIDADATGVEAGVATAKRSIASLGSAAREAGKAGADGLSSMGDGADASTKKIEAATRNTINSIQRQIAAFEAGGTSSRQYQESLAKMRGIDVSALKPYLDQLDAAKAKHAGGADAAINFKNAMSQVSGGIDLAKSSALAFGAAMAGSVIAGLSVNAFKSLILGSVESAAKLHDLAIQTGATVEALSGLGSIGKFSDVGVDQIATSMNKLAKNMAGATEESKGTGKALEAIGLDFKQFAALSPEDQMQAVASAMGGFQDGAGKSAVAMALFGKEGAKMLPFFKDLADVGGIAAKVTTAQAAAADNFSDNLTRLNATSSAWRKELAMGMIPALNLGVQAFVDVANGAGGMRETVRGLSNDGSLTSWTTSAITGLTYLMDVFAGVKRVLWSIGESIGGIAAIIADSFGTAGEVIAKVLRGDIAGAFAANEAAGRRQSAMWSELKTSIDAAWTDQTTGQKMRQRMEELNNIGTVAVETKKKLNFVNLADKAVRAEPKDAELATMQSLIKATEDRIAVLREQATVMSPLTDGEKTLAKLLAASTEGYSKAAIAAREHAKALIEGEISLEKAAAALKAQDDYISKLGTAGSAELKRLTDLVAKQEDHNFAIGKTKEQVEAYRQSVEEAATVQLQAQVDAVEGWLAEQTEASKAVDIYQEVLKNLQDQIKARKDLARLYGQGAMAESQLAVEKEITAERKRGWEATDNLARSVFTAWAEDGSNAGKKIGDTLKKALLSAIYDATIKPLVFQIYANVLGLNTGGAQGVASSLLGGNSGSSMISSLMPNPLTGVTSAATGAFSAGSTLSAAGMGSEAFSAGVTMMSEATGMSSFAAGAGQALGAMGPAGWAALAAIAILSMGGKAFETKYGGTYDTSGPDNSIKKIYGPGTGGEFGDKYTQLAIAHSQNSTNQVLARLGSKDRVGYWAAGAETSQEGQGFAFAGGKLTSGAAFGTSLGNGYLQNRGNKDVKQAMEDLQHESQVATLAAIQVATGVPKNIADTLKGLDLTEHWKESIVGVEQAAITMVGAQGELITLQEATHAVTTRTLELGSLSKEELKKLMDVITFQMNMMDMPFKNLQTVSAAAAQGLADAAGGFDKLNSSLGNYYNLFYSDAERNARSMKQMSDEFDTWGVKMPQSKDEFRALFESIDLTSESGRRAAARLLEVAPAFAALADAAEASLARMQAAADAAQSDLTRARQNVIDAQAAIDKQVAAQAAAQAAALKEAQTFLAGASTNIRQWLDQLNSTDAGGLSADQQRTNAWAALQTQYTLAQGGSRDALTGITGYADTYIAAIKASSKSAAEEAAAIAKVKAQVGNLPNQVSAEQFIVNAINDNGAATLAELERLRQVKIVAELTVAAYSEITKLISFVTNTDKLPDDLKQIALAESSTMAKTIELVANSNNLTFEEKTAILQGSSEATRLINLALGSDLPDEYKRLALKTYDNITKAVSFTVENILDPVQRQLALSTTGEVLKTIKAAAGTMDANALKVAAAQSDTVNKTIQASGGVLTDDQRKLLSDISSYNKEIQLIISSGSANSVESFMQAHFGTKQIDVVVNMLGGDASALVGGYVNDLLSKVRSGAMTEGQAVANAYTSATRYHVTQQDIATATGYNLADIQAMFDRYSIPRFAVGTDFVPRDMLAMIHQGEQIVPRAYNPHANGMGGNGASGQQATARFEEAMARIQDDNRRINIAVVTQLQEIKRIHKNWNTQGMPQPRTEAITVATPA